MLQRLLWRGGLFVAKMSNFEGELIYTGSNKKTDRSICVLFNTAGSKHMEFNFKTSLWSLCLWINCL